MATRHDDGSRIKIITPPPVEQISLEIARAHLRLALNDDSPPASDDDFWLSNIGIPAARGYCESFLARALAPQVIELALDAFSTTLTDGTTRTKIELPMAPVRSVESVKYVDADGDEQTLAADQYALDNYSEPCWLLPVTTWPSAKAVANGIKIRLNVGYTLPDDSPNDTPLPHALLIAMLLVLGHLNENREATSDLRLTDLPLGVQHFLVGHQLRLSMA